MSRRKAICQFKLILPRRKSLYQGESHYTVSRRKPFNQGKIHSTTCCQKTGGWGLARFVKFGYMGACFPKKRCKHPPPLSDLLTLITRPLCASYMIQTVVHCTLGRAGGVPSSAPQSVQHSKVHSTYALYAAQQNYIKI